MNPNDRNSRPQATSQTAGVPGRLQATPTTDRRDQTKAKGKDGLLNPMTLMVMGLAGGAVASVHESRESSSSESAHKSASQADEVSFEPASPTSSVPIEQADAQGLVHGADILTAAIEGLNRDLALELQTSRLPVGVSDEIVGEQEGHRVALTDLGMPVEQAVDMQAKADALDAGAALESLAAPTGIGSQAVDADVLLAQASGSPAPAAAPSGTAGSAAAASAAGGGGAAAALAAIGVVAATVAIASGGSARESDTAAPTATIELSDTALKIGETATVTITFSEAVTGFALEDLIAQNGQLSNLVQSGTNPLVYTATFTPTADIEDATNVVSLSTAYTDAAGNTGTAATSANYAVDTVGPTLLRLEAHSNGGTEPGTIDLVYDEPMSTADLPAVGAFLVSINGSTVTPTGVSVNGEKVTLTFDPGVVVAGNLNLSIQYGDPTAGDDATAIQDAAGNDAPSIDLSSGVVADGYIRGAQMYLDGPNGLIELEGVITDDFGNFYLASGSNPNGYALVAVGGVNIDTGLPNTTALKAPAGSTTINPLTTLVQAVIDQAEEQGQTIDATTAAGNVAAALGLTIPEGKSLTTYDPLSATGDDAVAAQKAAAQVATLVTLASSEAADTQAASSQVLNNLASVVTSAVTTADQNGGQTTPFSLSDASVLSQALAGVTVSEATQGTIVEAASTIASAASVSSISAAQSQFVDKIAPAAPTSLVTASVTNDTTPAVDIRLDVLSTGGKAAVVGDTVVLLDGQLEIGRTTLTQSHIDAGRVSIDAQTLAEGQHLLAARVIDKAGNTGTLSASKAVTVDLSAPAGVLTADSDNLAAGSSTTLTLTFGEPIVGLTLDDLQVTGGGTLSALSAPQTIDGQQVYTVTFTAPAAGGASVAGSVQLLGDGYSDAAGNKGVASNAVDLAAVNPPVVTITGAGGTDRVISGQAGDAVISGSGLAVNGLVTLKAGDTVLGTATVTSGRWSYALTEQNLTDLGQGPGKVITASQTRTVGDNDYTGTASTTVSIDTSAPDLPTFNDVAGDGLVNAAEKASGVQVSGTADIGARVELSLGGSTHVLTPDESGAWSYNLTSADYRILGSSATVSAVAVDAAGNRSAAATHTFAVDTSAPTLGLVRLDAGSDSGTAGDGRTSDRTPTITFTAESGSGLDIDIGQGFKGVAVAQGTGEAQSLPLSDSDLADGPYTVRLKAVDAAGNESIRTATIVVDSTGPTFTSGGAATAIAENSGANQIIYTAKATDASLVAYSLKSVDDASHVSVDPRTGQVKLADNPNFEAKSAYAFTLVATDTAGNASEQSVTLAINDVNEAPTAVGLTGALASIDENTATAQRIEVATIAITDDALGEETVSLSGADASAFEVDGGKLYLKAGTSLDHEAKGSYAVTVNVADAALAGSTPVSTAYAISVADVNEAPSAIDLSATHVAENGAAGASVATLTAADPDGAATAFAGPFTFALVSGVGDTDNARFSIDGDALKLTSPANFEAQSSYAIRLRVTDQGGLTFETQRTITVDNLNETPLAPESISAPFIATNVAYSFDLASLIVDPDAGDTLTFTLDAQTSLPNGLTLSSSGLISGTVTQAGETQVTVIATDADGLSVTRSFDITAVDAPAFSSVSATPPLVKGGDAFTLTATLTEQVVVSNGTPTLKLTVGDQSVTATYSGAKDSATNTLTFSATAPASANSSNVTISAFDAGGASIIGEVSGRDLTPPVNVAVAQLVVDNTAPTLTIIDDEAAATANIAGGDITFKFTFTEEVSGFESADITVANGTKGTLIPSNLSGEVNKVYTLAVTPTPGFEGNVTVDVAVGAVTDMVGNILGTAVQAVQAVDLVAPSAPTINTVATDDVVNASEQTATISGTSDADASIALSLGGNTRTVTADGSGKWSYTLDSVDITAMGQGAETLSAAVIDAAGNTSSAATRSISVDTEAPSAPTIATVATDNIISTGELSSAIAGTAEANAVVALSLGGNTRTLAADGNGNWSYSLTPADITAMGQGAETISATATDAAGNTSTAATLSVTLDISVPSLTSALSGITNLDVTSAIVLQASEAVIKGTGSIRIMNDGGAGFRGENADHDQVIDVGSAAVTIQGNLIIVRPPFDLDLANAYHIEVEAGAFTGASTSLASLAIIDPAAITFATVTPGSGVAGVSAGVASQTMDLTTGGLVASYKWLDIEGVGSPSASAATVMDLVNDDIALVFKDYDDAGGSVNDATDGIAAPDLYVRAVNFGVGDMLYADNQNPSAVNLFDQTTVLADTPDAGVTQLSFGGFGLGGVIEVDIQGSDAVFGAIASLGTLLGGGYEPIGELVPASLTFGG